MLFTTTSPAGQGDRILLYLDPDEARIDARDGQTVFGVAVGLDRTGRRLTGEGPSPSIEEPDWNTPAYFEDVRRIMARGPIPDAYFSRLGSTLCC